MPLGGNIYFVGNGTCSYHDCSDVKLHICRPDASNFLVFGYDQSFVFLYSKF